MKKCPNCNTIYKDYDQYCLQCRYKLQYIEGTETIDYCSDINTINKKIQTQPTNLPKCPTCGSKNIKYISTLNRAVSIGVFGILSGKIGKNYECLNCKARW